VDDLQKEKGIGCKKYNKPSVIVVVPGVDQVEDVYKLLLKQFKKFNGKSNLKGVNYDVRITKMFGKHLKPADFKNILGQKHPNRKNKEVLNVYLGPPGRLNILAD
jgi:hypothetical protein